ncbi:type II toxin-antitoxin system RelE/ParE family toxin [Curtanaerobium respiraculi]|uniref:type II toxin-antitoxin system RelE/ParE family toxin n=1 Tax=Curtanaerobium respiraculi TaxID=2949669 RepID=UPI0024B34137|nr:type II toxin-antitoxin system RelE/ParE family toxin [Curtanaerobium respiraculi]
MHLLSSLRIFQTVSWEFHLRKKCSDALHTRPVRVGCKICGFHGFGSDVIAGRLSGVGEGNVLFGNLNFPPGNRLEFLRDSMKGQWPIRVNSQWRICFRFENGDAYDVEFCDYH